MICYLHLIWVGNSPYCSIYNIIKIFYELTYINPLDFIFTDNYKENIKFLYDNIEIINSNYIKYIDDVNIKNNILFINKTKILLNNLNDE